jgi:hypothetical protein
MPPYDELKTLLAQLFRGISAWQEMTKRNFIETLMQEMNITQKPVEGVIEYVRNLMRERYLHANKEG